MTATFETTGGISLDEDNLITDDIDFRVELRTLYAHDEEFNMKMPEHKATIRVNPDGTKKSLWVVGSRYQIVDHRDVIRQFAETLQHAGMNAKVRHEVYRGGCRIFSIFTIDKEYEIPNSKCKAKPFFALTTSHDGSLKVGFLMGAKVGTSFLNVSKTVYGASARHVRGINVEKALKEIEKALDVFTNEVIPMWEKMQRIEIDQNKIDALIEDAVNHKVISKRRSEDLNISQEKSTIWDLYTTITEEVSKVGSRKGSTKEAAFWRNADASEYFTKLMRSDAALSKALETKEKK